VDCLNKTRKRNSGDIGLDGGEDALDLKTYTFGVL